MSGRSNVEFWLRFRGLDPAPSLVDAIFERAKSATHTLTEAEILALCRERGVVGSK